MVVMRERSSRSLVATRRRASTGRRGHRTHLRWRSSSVRSRLRSPIRDLKGSIGGPDHLRALRGSAGLTEPAWSPDGKRLAAVSSAGLWVLNADGSGKRPLAGCGANHPAWSPDGSQIVFACGSKSIDVIDPAGGPPRRIYQLSPGAREADGARPEAVADPTWSPDATVILFAVEHYYATLPPGWEGSPGLRWGLWTVRPEGTGLRRAAIGDGFLHEPTVSWQPIRG